MPIDRGHSTGNAFTNRDPRTLDQVNLGDDRGFPTSLGLKVIKLDYRIAVDTQGHPVRDTDRLSSQMVYQN